ncbi:MAG: bifunctional 23S rRNA (guanine(2069)-N(7))-methyltransferase RlmK/23S rRNA (guanine(2445)-N(2))-methyltransferase RlmL [Cellvibrionales bacterium]|jgi:23S rRNA (guanine2445-N2)-methyltransferase / 23S rRNA (guanine2069-N7)-methyltransferase|nr:MAG: bifunctional 23S rRNA (guanine(2069)-N(7))-methyltransferase RlmK/23S rRNA (guanine(2445)-N(2))-methyltransferase RlmL [Cellvibrionales bacterium]HRG49797.1 bifunctional 23S rRNA (guanine(2069)-N(7))-methyltransferase RlmK/23S rRNA (guanine(2445)-N(2))-methyltransferase RlmL [Pseudomonadales bacterium]
MTKLTMKPLHFIATCARAQEPLLAQELEALFAQDVVAGDRIVSFSASPEVIYRVLLGTRIANRVLWPVCTVPANDGDEMYQALREYDWATLLKPHNTFCIDFIGESETIRNSMFGAMRVKDALVDSVRVGDARPSVVKDAPDIRFNTVLLSNEKQTDRVQVAVDLGNGSLHKRGYRQQAGEAPLKETVAAGMLLRAGWPAIAQAGGALFDPMCGSGTLLIEAALMAANIAPGVYREQWGVQHCPWHDEVLWKKIQADAKSRLLNVGAISMPKITGSDMLVQVVKKARENIERAGLSECISVDAEHLADSMPPRAKTGLLICNPPYGERLGDAAELPALYAMLGEKMSALHGWQAAVLTSEKSLAQAIGLRSHRSYRFDNGALACRLYLFELSDRNRFKAFDASAQHSAQEAVSEVEQLSDAARMLCNRLQKNAQKLRPWLKQSGVTCYRLYDADMPEYAFAIDVYTHAETGELHVHLQEYAPPKTVDESAAARRREETRLAVSAALKIPLSRVYGKNRERQRGEKKQYSKQEVVADTRFPVQENGHIFQINMQSYLDTGLFLDTRPVRQLVAEKAKGKDFLNLFSYTASATVYAAKGGARSSLSIDMSATYTDWARHHFASNDINTRKHQLLTADCLQWLEEADEQFDFIYLDPPTFSNSKRMHNTLDVQRDQVQLIGYALDLLSENGELIFVTNHQRFKLEEAIFIDHGWRPENITAQTLDVDFQRSKKIHQCWLFRRA